MFLFCSKAKALIVLRIKLSPWLAGLWGLICPCLPFCLCVSYFPSPWAPGINGCLLVTQMCHFTPSLRTSIMPFLLSGMASVLLFWPTFFFFFNLSLHTTSLHPPTWYWVSNPVTLSQSTYHTVMLRDCPLHWKVTPRGHRRAISSRNEWRNECLYVRSTVLNGWIITFGVHCTLGGHQ